MKYRVAFLLSILIILYFFFAPIYFHGKVDTRIEQMLDKFYPAITAIGGFLFAILIKLFWKSYTDPVIEIKREIEPRSFHPLGGTLEYVCNRIIVKNVGRSAAKNCKGYIITGNAQERVCWTVPAERPNATINARDEERLDFCAFLINYRPGVGTEEPPSIIVPTETGWDNNRHLNGITECNVLITAENAEPVSKRIRFNLDTGEINWV